MLRSRAQARRLEACTARHGLPPEANGYEPPPQDATPRSAFRIVSGDAPQ